MNLGEVLARSSEFLARKGIESARLEAELLLAQSLSMTRLDLYLHHDRPLTAPEQDAARELLRRRGTREPLAYVLGAWGFRRLTLKTDARALVPRPETEIVVERCLALLAGRDAPRVLDVGTGTGAIALAIADEHPGARVTALDVSPAALALAAENVAATGLAVDLLEGDALAGLPAGPWDLVVSNPPYVLADEQLPPELAFEPRGALVEEGHTEAVARHARDVLAGALVLEIHAERADEVAGLLRELGYADVAVTRDLAGRDRVVEGTWGR